MKDYLKGLSIVGVGATIFGLGYVLMNRKPAAKEVTATETVESISEEKKCMPTFVDGGGPYYLPNSPFRSKLVPEGVTGDKLMMSGRVVRSDCQTVVANAVVDVWQADSEGEYNDVWYRGRIKTDEEGKYQFESIVPLGYGEGTGYRPPHIHFKVWEGDKEIVTSQMFFPEIIGTPGFDSAYVMTVVRLMEDGRWVKYGEHDIVLP